MNRLLTNEQNVLNKLTSDWLYFFTVYLALYYDLGPDNLKQLSSILMFLAKPRRFDHAIHCVMGEYNTT